MLSFSDSVFLPYDFAEYAKDLRRGEGELTELMKQYQPFKLNLERLNRAITTFEEAAHSVNNVTNNIPPEMACLIGLV